MTIEKAIFNRIYAQAGVKGMVSTRIYPNGQVPDNPTYPMLTQEVQSTTRPGILSERCPVSNYQIRVTGWTKTQAELVTLMGGVEDALDVWQDKPAVQYSSLQDSFSEPNPDFPFVFTETKVFSVWYAKGE